MNTAIQTKSTQPHPIIYLESIDSTNEEAKRRLKDPHTPHPKTPFAIVANTQTQGKGQRNHHWESGSEDGLYYTLVIEPEQFEMTALQSYYNQIGALIINIIKTQSGRHAHLKQPNDILIDNKKSQQQSACQHVSGGIVEEPCCGAGHLIVGAWQQCKDQSH